MKNIVKMRKIFVTLVAAATIGISFSASYINIALAEEGTRPIDSNLEQSVEENEKIVQDKVSIDNGHIDIGPRIVDDKLGLFLRDDSVSPSVWRKLDKTVLHLKDNSKKRIPEKEEFSFIKENTDGYVYVSPQIQKEGVVWAGWNTQSPEIIEKLSKGAILRLLNVQGPGQLAMFLESGTFGPPTLLWDSSKDEGQDIWMDLNTHTHANWVFTKPGIYLVNLELSVQLKDGTIERSINTLRFAVGNETNIEEALSIKAEPNKKNLSQDLEQEVTRQATDDEKIQTIKPIIYAGIAIVTLGIILVMFVVIRNNKNKKQAYAQIENME